LNSFLLFTDDSKDKSSKHLLLDDFEKSLFSEERLDASSPVLWPEQSITL